MLKLFLSVDLCWCDPCRTFLWWTGLWNSHLGRLRHGPREYKKHLVSQCVNQRDICKGLGKGPAFIILHVFVLWEHQETISTPSITVTQATRCRSELWEVLRCLRSCKSSCALTDCGFCSTSAVPSGVQLSGWAAAPFALQERHWLSCGITPGPGAQLVYELGSCPVPGHCQGQLHSGICCPECTTGEDLPPAAELSGAVCVFPSTLGTIKQTSISKNCLSKQKCIKIPLVNGTTFYAYLCVGSQTLFYSKWNRHWACKKNWHCWRWLQIKLEQNQLSLEEERTNSALCRQLLMVHWVFLVCGNVLQQSKPKPFHKKTLRNIVCARTALK